MGYISKKGLFPNFEPADSEHNSNSIITKPGLWSHVVTPRVTAMRYKGPDSSYLYYES